MTTFLAFVFVLGVLVFVHELGHFLAAKRVGIRVLKFQLGFNPTMLSFRRGDTEYSIGALPLGGYVKMAGENPGRRARTAARSDEFLSKTKWERFQVLIMGPVMNLAAGRRAHGRRALSGRRGAGVYEDQPPVVGAVAADSPAPRADIQPGDGSCRSPAAPVDTWEQFFIAVGTRPNREVALGLAARRPRDDTQGDAGRRPSRAGSRSATSACCPNVHPHVRVGQRRRAGRARPASRPATSSSPSTASRSPSTTQLREAIAKHPEQPMQITCRSCGGGSRRPSA